MASADAREFLKLKKQIDTFRRRADRALGALEQHMAALKKEFGCSSEQEAEALLKRLKRLESKLDRQYNNALESFKQEFGHLLEATDNDDN